MNTAENAYEVVVLLLIRLVDTQSLFVLISKKESGAVLQRQSIDSEEAQIHECAAFA